MWLIRDVEAFTEGMPLTSVRQTALVLTAYLYGLLQYCSHSPPSNQCSVCLLRIQHIPRKL